jgi:hypothetical protein
MVSFRTRVAGIYRARYDGTSVRELDDQDTGEKVSRWLWIFSEVSTGDEISKWTGTDPRSPNSNAHRMLAGVMGRKPQDGDDTDTMTGRLYDVVYGPNQAGNLTITSVVLVQDAAQPAQDAPQQPATPAVAPAATEADGGAVLDF